MPAEILGVGNLAAEGGQQIRGVELDVVEHLGHGVAVNQVGDLVALLGEPDVHRVGVAEEVVQVAQDLLIGAGKEDPEDVGLPFVHRMKLERGLALSPAGEAVDHAVRVAGDVL